jgi:hypothetical protein
VRKVPDRRHRAGEDPGEEGVGEVLAGLLGADPQRVEQTPVSVGARQLDRLGHLGDPGQGGQAVVALRVDVDDRAGALQEGLPEEQLEQDRLARAEAPRQQTGRRPR